MKRCRLFKRKHTMFIVRRNFLGQYVFECKTCGHREVIHQIWFWKGRYVRNPIAEWMYRNA